MIDHDAVRNAFLGLGLVGDEKDGILRKFNVILKADNAGYLVGREFDLIDNMGGEPSRKLAEKVLIDAAQWCANATFSGIMSSGELFYTICSHMPSGTGLNIIRKKRGRPEIGLSL